MGGADSMILGVWGRLGRWFPGCGRAGSGGSSAPGSFRGGLGAAESALESPPRGSWLVGLLAALCFAICLAASYIFNSGAVPWLVSVARDSWLGAALSLAPATAPVLLDRLGATLFDVEDTWGALKVAVFCPGSRWARWLSRSGFFITVAGIHLYTIWLLADLRDISAFLQRGGYFVTAAARQQSRIDHALLVLSLVVAVDGALFYLLGLHELRGAAARRRARREAAALRAAVKSG